MKLPDLPSLLIRVALDDLYKCVQSPDYLIDFSQWYKVRNRNAPSDQFSKNKIDLGCFVCFAGAVMAQSLGLSSTYKGRMTESTFDEEVWNKMHALDSFRKGFVETGLKWLNIPVPKGMGTVCVVPQNDYKGFVAAMEGLIETLKEHSL